jgi:hypothetical protein
MFFFPVEILIWVMNMYSSKKLLTSILRTTQMGQIGIRSVLDKTTNPALRRALESQLTEYDTIESEAHILAAERGWELQELDPGVRAITDMMTRIRVPKREPDSRIADLMILGNTKGMVKSLKNLHRFDYEDARISTISQKLLDCETANIRQMKGFL